MKDADEGVESIARSAKHHGLQCMEIWGGHSTVNQTVTTPGLEIRVRSRTYHGDEYGGDVHYVSLCGAGLITRLIVADVSGHGTTVAESARSLRDLMRRHINRKNQSRLVQELNKRFAVVAEQGRFATALVATYLAHRDELTLCNAGHPRPIWYRARARQWQLVLGEDVKASTTIANLPLGILDSTSYESAVLTLEPNDLLLFYTDALTEAHQPDGKMLGEAGLLEMLSAIDPSRVGEVLDSLDQALSGFQGTSQVHDDLTYMLIHHNGSNPKRLSLTQKLDVYAKVFGLKSV
jgi:serine phosphatase RsbU (regulator of sigma subunit)